MQVFIHDDFDLAKICASGQCFRPGPVSDGKSAPYRFITGEHVLCIRCVEGGMYDVSCSEAEWNSVWSPYFDLGRCYADVRASIPDSDPFLLKAASFSRGIRILRQDPWEMIISFIISQRKTIPAIRRSIEMLCERFGSMVSCGWAPGDSNSGCVPDGCKMPGCNAAPSVIHAFPSPRALADASADELAACSLGYRVPYVMDAAKKIASGLIDPEALYDRSYEERMEILKSICGVGEKVANCICLFGYGCTSAAPVDTWIRKVIDTVYAGNEPFSAFGENAGIVQQYVFYYAVSQRKI